MSDIDVSSEGGGHKQGRGVKKAKKLSTRVDMTPMVDLGFLLITFFIFTATLSTPTTMGLIMPKDEKDPKDLTEIKQSGALTIMLGKENQVYYYLGELKTDGSNFLSTNFKDIRKIIQDKKKEVISRHVHDPGCEKIWAKNDGDKKSCEDKDFVVVIKPNDEASYKNSVDMLDEMSINEVDRFAMVDITPDENLLVKATEKTNPNIKQ